MCSRRRFQVTMMQPAMFPEDVVCLLRCEHGETRQVEELLIHESAEQIDGLIEAHASIVQALEAGYDVTVCTQYEPAALGINGST